MATEEVQCKYISKWSYNTIINLVNQQLTVLFFMVTLQHHLLVQSSIVLLVAAWFYSNSSQASSSPVVELDIHSSAELQYNFYSSHLAAFMNQLQLLDPCSWA